jgi:putative glutamine amidotransferase
LIYIAVTSTHNHKEGYSSLNDSYVQALEAAGAIPVILPVSLSPEKSAQALARMDGLFFSGGPDISPLRFGQQPQPDLGSVDHIRDEQEAALFKAALERGLPMMGICRGIQVLNVMMGGTVIQHLGADRENAIQHRQLAPSIYPHHHVEVQGGTILAEALGEGTFAVNSCHHQAVGKVAPGLKVGAVAPDGVVEAIESVSPWILGIQFHPERLYPQQGKFLNVFHAFVAACRGEREWKK